MGTGAYVVDHTAGSVTRIDGATLEPQTPVNTGLADDQSLAVVSNAKATWVVERRATFAQEIDPFTMAGLGTPDALASGTAAPVETPDGTMWAAAAGGQLYSFRAGQAQARTRLFNGNYTLVEAASHAVAVSATAGRILVLDPASGRGQRSVAYNPAGTHTEVSGGGDQPYVVTVGATEGEVQVTDIDTGRSTNLIIGDESGAVTRYGPAVVKGQLVFIPDFVGQGVIVVRVQGDRLTLLGEVPVDASRFDVVQYDGSVWFDDPASDLAGLINSNLESILISKTTGAGKGRRIGQLGPVPSKEATPKTPPTTSVSPTTNASATPTTASLPPISTVSPPTSTLTPPASTATPPPGGSSPTSAAPTSASPTTASPKPVPWFGWSPVPAVAGGPVTFTDATTGTHKVFQWTFTGRSPATSAATLPTVTWTLPGTYTVTLVVTDRGLSYPVQRQVQVVSQTAPSTTTTSSTTTTTTTMLPAVCTAGSVTITPGKAVQWTVPAACTSVGFVVTGGAGGAEGEVSGGRGASVALGMTVTPGEVFTLTAGGAGGADATGGYNGGGNGGGTGANGQGGGGGGGMSDVKSAAGSELIIAAGGGGATAGGCCYAGGADSGANGDTTVSTGLAGHGGTAGTATGGGTGGGCRVEGRPPPVRMERPDTAAPAGRASSRAFTSVRGAGAGPACSAAGVAAGPRAGPTVTRARADRVEADPIWYPAGARRRTMGPTAAPGKSWSPGRTPGPPARPADGPGREAGSPMIYNPSTQVSAG
ncbi:MAG TPA: PKD domain-containing protein [Acidimicrobiales bacterium]|nr:PKD domain-containing protein [Acidimicrobiales bacterium]